MKKQHLLSIYMCCICFIVYTSSAFAAQRTKVKYLYVNDVNIQQNAYTNTDYNTVVIGPLVKTIASNAFSNCTIKKTIWMPNVCPSGTPSCATGSVNYISSRSTYPKTYILYENLTSIFEVDGIKYVPVNKDTCDVIDCNYNSSQISVNIGSTVTYGKRTMVVRHIQDYACYDDDKIAGDIILSNQGNVGSYAFSLCSNAKTVDVSNNGYIGQQAFSKCTSLTTANVHNRGYVGKEAFLDCIISRQLDLSNSSYIAINAFRNVKGNYVANINNKGSLGDNAFNSSRISSLSVDNNVTSIGIGCFANCTISQQATLNNKGLINRWAFCEASGNFDIIINNSGKIAIGAFKNSKLKNLSITNNVTTVEDSCFANSTISQQATIENNGSIGKSAFCFTGESYQATINNTGALLDSAFYKSQLSILKIGKNVTSLGSECFRNSTISTSALLENTGTIGGSAFRSTLGYYSVNIQTNGALSKECFAVSQLSSVTLGNNVTELKDFCFSSSTGYKRISLSNSIKSIGPCCFSGCEMLEQIDLANVKTIYENAFYSCVRIREIRIPKSTMSIGNQVFSKCSALKNVIIEDRKDVLSLGNNYNKKASSNDSIYRRYRVIYQDYKGLKGVGTPLFSDCPLDSVYIGGPITYDSSKETGYSPFFYNEKLRSATITNNEETVYTNEFYNCLGLQNVKLGPGVKTVKPFGFQSCIGLLNFEFAGTLESIGAQAFSDCSNITTIISHAINPPVCGTQALQDINMWNCSVYVPSGCAAAYEAADQWKNFDIYELAEIATGISLDKITLTLILGKTATLTATVTPTTATQSVTWTSSNPDVATVNDAGVVTAISNGTATITARTNDGSNLSATCEVMVRDDIGIITFADANVKAICVANWDKNVDGELDEDEAAAVTSLGEVFKNKTTITSFDELQYFTGLTTVSKNAFYGCGGLTSVTIPSNVTSIGDCAFECCSGLTSVTIPNSVTKIGNYVFKSCFGLTSVTIPNGVTSIGNSAFRDCTSLTSITIPNSVTSIGDGAFYGCSGLTSITIPNSVTGIGDVAFQNCSKLTSITIPNSVTSLGSGVFINCSSLTSVTISNSVTSFGENTFRNCTGLTSITIPENVTSIGNQAFRNCSNLTSVTCLAENVPETGESVFSGVPQRDAKLYVPESSVNEYKTANQWKEFGEIMAIEDSPIIVFADANVKAICVKNWDKNGDGELDKDEAAAVTSLGEVFKNKTTIASFNELQYFTGLATIGQNAFQNCPGLTSVTIPESVTSIGDNAFNNCFYLTSVTIPNSVTSIGGGVFAGCSGLMSVTIPNNVTSIGGSAFVGCTRLTEVTCLAESVPATGSSVFYMTPQSTATLYVPAGSVDAYKAAEQWKNFGTITAYTIPATSVALNKTEATIEVGAQEQLTATVLPEEAEQAVTWTSSDPAVATVDESGLVTAVAAGTATITATTDGTRLTASCKVTVEDSAIPGDVNGDGNVNGADIVAVINYVLADNIAGDVNGDGNVNGADIVAVINYVLNDSGNNARSTLAQSRTAVAEEPAEILSGTKTQEGISLSLTGGEDCTAFQFMLSLPEGVSLTAVIGSEERLGDHELLFRRQEDGRYLVMGFAMDNRCIGKSSGELLSLLLAGNANGRATVSEALIFTPQAETRYMNALDIDLPTAVSGVRAKDAVEDGDIYDLMGRRLQQKPASGYYIQGGKKYLVK